MPENVPFVDLGCLPGGEQIRIQKQIEQVIASSSFVSGHQVEAFEEGFSTYCESDHCVGVNSGTDALFLALKALGVGEGDEVITTPFSFIATSQAILRTGADVVFVDITPDTYNINAKHIKSRITRKSKAIVPVHLYGRAADMDTISALAKKYNLLVVADAAQAHGATYQGRKVSALGDAACFSFYPTKNLGAWGDAGAVVTNNEELAHKIRALANHGRSRFVSPTSTGYNSRLDTIQAAVLNVKLPFLDRWNQQRRAHAGKYFELLKNTPLHLPAFSEESGAVCHQFTVRTPTGHRDSLREFLAEKAIETRVYYDTLLSDVAGLSLNSDESKADIRSDDFPSARMATQTVVSLPVSPAISSEQVEYVAACVVSYFKKLD